MKKTIITAAVFITLFAPAISLVYAQVLQGTGNNSQGTGNTTTVAPVLITNPLSSSYSSIPNLVGGLLNVVEYIGGICCAIWIIWGGFLFVKAQGNPEALSDAKKTLLHAVIGTAIILGAGVILSVIQNIINTVKAPQ
jgi:hypothetical protein